MTNHYIVEVEYLMGNGVQVFKTVKYHIIARSAEDARAFVCNYLELRGEHLYQILSVAEEVNYRHE